MAFKEIVTKAIIAKGKKKYKNTYEINVEEKPSTILGCWIINHNFKAHEAEDEILIDGSFDANIWYSYDNDTKTTVASKRITYSEKEKIAIPNEEVLNKDVIVRSLKQPTCTSAKEDGNTISLEIEKELGIEIIGDTKVKISSIDSEDDTWDDLDVTNETEKELNKINENYIKEETIN